MKNTNNIIEISNSVRTSEESGTACGPFCSLMIVAETILERDGKKVYLTSSWIDQAPEDIEEDITNDSIADTMLMLDDDIERLDMLRGEHVDCSGIPCSDYFDKMRDKIVEKLREIGEDKSTINMLLGIEDDEEEEEDEDEEESLSVECDDIRRPAQSRTCSITAENSISKSNMNKPLKAFNEGGRVLVYGMNTYMENLDLIPTMILEQNGTEYAVIANNADGDSLCFPCARAPYDGDPMQEISSMVNFITPEAEECLKSSSQLRVIKDY